MPSRTAVIGILLFWLATTSSVLYRELRPRYFGDEPPVVSIDIADEATPALPIYWDIFRDDKKIGMLSTRMVHEPSDDTFRFISKYSKLKFEFPVHAMTVSMEVPVAETMMRVTRDGRLREQKMSGRIECWLDRLMILSADASIVGRVENNRLVGQCVCKSPLLNIDRPLEPLEVPDGQVLNPLMPVNRLKNVVPGREWNIRLVDPLSDSVQLLAGESLKSHKMGLVNLGESEAPVLLLARVLREKQTIDRPASFGGPVVCWVIEYRADDTKAWTWVSVADGRVIRQQASRLGIDMRFERRD